MKMKWHLVPNIGFTTTLIIPYDTVEAGLRIRIIVFRTWLQIQRFTIKWTWIPDLAFHFNTDPDPAGTNLRPLVSILCLRVSIVSVHGPLKLLNLYFNADPDPAFHSYADPDPQL
jgi:hypothetical protein